jgi:S-adenosylmethionine:tRNA ribosyltransferase-isomerase
MIAAHQPIQRPPQARLLVVDACRHITQTARRELLASLRPGDLVVANDAATLPASLTGRHLPSGQFVEVRLAARRSLALEDVKDFWAVVFGAGDFHTPTERRPSPPQMSPGDRLALGSLSATIVRLLGHPRLIALGFDGSPDEIWAGIARNGRPIQYAHLDSALALWDVWTAIAGPPVAFEPPSAGFALDWQMLVAMRAKGIEFATLTHAAGLSSTGDESLDARLPFDEPYVIPTTTATAIARARARGGRIVAIGTTVVRALEHAALPVGQVRAGHGVATQRIDGTTTLHVVDAILTGVHEPGTSHYQLLGAFLDKTALSSVQETLEAQGFRTHEFGDSVFIERPHPRVSRSIEDKPNLCRLSCAS